MLPMRFLGLLSVSLSLSLSLGSYCKRRLLSDCVDSYISSGADLRSAEYEYVQTQVAYICCYNLQERL